MGFKSLIESQVQGAMRVLGTSDDGLAAAHTYAEMDLDGTGYNPETGEMEETIIEHAGVPMVLAKFRIEEMDTHIVPTTDMKVLIAALDLPVEPKEQDLIYLTNGLTYMVMRILGVPGESLHILHVRQTQRPA